MSVWPGKYVIGLTGNIATGKSVVRRMLEALGAYGINADTLAHRVMEPGSAGYQKVISAFGREILSSNGEIDRSQLGQIVFSDPQALSRLELIIHPEVRKAENILIPRVRQRIVVVEAIKLIEAGLADLCDVVWVTKAARATQLERLVTNRSHSPEIALQRIEAQPPQELKLQRANVIIDMDCSFKEAWRQVEAHYPFLSSLQDEPPGTSATLSRIELKRLLPGQNQTLIEYLRMFSTSPPRSSANFYKLLTEKAVLVVKLDNHPVGLVSWIMENFITCICDFIPKTLLKDRFFFTLLTKEIERYAKESYSEILLWALPGMSQTDMESLVDLDYLPVSPDRLSKAAWQNVVQANKLHASQVYARLLETDLYFLGNSPLIRGSAC
jgi:dephospho-CoA kinase